MEATVTARAVLQRINRRLKPELKQVRTTRGRWAVERNFGQHYLIDLKQNWISNPNVDFEGLARDLDALLPWEKVEGEGRGVGVISA